MEWNPNPCVCVCMYVYLCGEVELIYIYTSRSTTITRYLLWTGLEGGDGGWEMEGWREGGRWYVCLVGSGEGI